MKTYIEKLLGRLEGSSGAEQGWNTLTYSSTSSPHRFTTSTMIMIILIMITLSPGCIDQLPRVPWQGDQRIWGDQRAGGTKELGGPKCYSKQTAGGTNKFNVFLKTQIEDKRE